jgi:hypothetical protein
MAETPPLPAPALAISFFDDLDVAARGLHLLHVLKDYLEVGDNGAALQVLAAIAPSYFFDHLPFQVAGDARLAEVVATIIETWGMHFHLLATPRQGSS